MSRLGTAIVVALLTACSGNVSGTVALLVINYQPAPCCSDGGEDDAGVVATPDGGTDGGVEIPPPPLDAGFSGYELAAENVTTLRNVIKMTGGAATLVQGGALLGDRAAIVAANPANQAAFDKAIVTTPSTATDLDYIEAASVIQPVDAVGLATTTSYYNFEQAQLFFQAVSPSVTPGDVTVRVDPTVTSPSPSVLSLITDDAFSQPFLHEFVIQTTSAVPGEVAPSLQIGVIGHRYAHAIFQAVVFPGGGLPWLETQLAANGSKFQEVANLVSSLDEGLADYFGATIAVDPNFVRTAPGIPDPTRMLDVTVPRCLTASITANLASQDRAQYSPYPLGSILSAILWDLATDRPDLVVELNQSLLTGMGEFSTRLQKNQNQETLADAIDAFASQLPSDLQPRACGEFLDRFQMTREDIPSCTESRTPEMTCAASL